LERLRNGSYIPADWPAPIRYPASSGPRDVDRVGQGYMRRREFISLLGGVAAWPLDAWAQEPLMPVRIGFLRPSPAPERALAAFRSGLAENGFEAGRHYDLITRWAREPPSTWRN
jgi:hypothetical protein